ncbi:dolichyl-phosphate beta-glucosyltransferase [Bifidobacterium psychraerophilum]|jgi:glycosyltransferase involved in cell wall biosynthesis|uniref:dolichyl-phosphate beta-glucosyltransferase n=1 Tax=Bifidobacterium psychraerophilum TaxID=218140 RepID=UPI0023F22CB5|nr:dolichyl-phosphate beta-glucosyltransferase [Bifidobacterium psychraerophilum]MCI1660015.1 glycosyltransferase family 2 protein [Bifidobacterium psychraerophilum]MCI1804639.1 glycosyltransferase family 2 protein [Bifidobacterium psychraerophilum]MCI2176976.1 glycosyltransferase family 2 protein [Bifidobacterium psychraerophilum]MCI2181814.1 glycosyltransferase family 2 protein [Bifidobacterium psychraerophilum]
MDSITTEQHRTSQDDQPTSSHIGIAERLGYPKHVDADIVIPVYNEEHTLDACIQKLGGMLAGHLESPKAFTWNIIIADNASTDDTWKVAERLCAMHPAFLRAVRIDRKGRGAALKASWSESLARVVAYMDVDLSTDINYTGALIGSLLAGGADVAIGSRLLSESDVTRSTKREFISRTYNLMLRTYLGVTFHDAQCGFKALTARAAHILLPKVEDNEWFFDTELLVLAEMRHMNIYEIPVTWVEDSDSRVNIPDTVSKDLTGMRRMRRTLRMERSGLETGHSRPRSTADRYSRQRYQLSSAYSSIGWDAQGQHELRGSLIELANVKVGA